MFTIYAISSANRNYTYIGITSNLSNRLDRHKAGYERTTRPYKPFKLIYTEIAKTRPEARIREKYLKSGEGREFLRKLK